MEALRRSGEVVAEAKTPAPVVAQSEAPVVRTVIAAPAPQEDPVLSRFFVPTQVEELTITLDKWEFKIRSPFVSEEEHVFSFAFDDKILSISPKFEASAYITYKGQTFHGVFGGTKLKLPGMPFSIISFFKIPES